MNKNVYQAILIALDAHRGQKDKAGIDYIAHPIWLALQIGRYDEDDIIVALLHDTVEDSSITIEELESYGFSCIVIDALKCLTRKKGEDYFDYIKGVKKNELATYIKLLDLEHNMNLNRIQNPTQKDIDRVEKYKLAVQILKEKIIYVSFDDGKTEKLLSECSEQELVEMRAEIRTIQKNSINGFVLEEGEQHPQKIKGKKFNPFYDSEILFHYDNGIDKRFLVETFKDEQSDIVEAISKELEKFM